jgi:hypothetical protein
LRRRASFNRSETDVAGDVTPDSAGTIAALEAHVATLKADVETLKAQLANAEGRADETIRASAAQLGLERARADKAIAAFESLAQRLEAMAEARRPWWRRLVG